MPRPSSIYVTVDALIFGQFNGKTAVLLVRRRNDPFRDHWAIPGGFVEDDEDLETAARRELLEETSVAAGELRQLHTFGAPDRDPRGRVVSIVYQGWVDAGSAHPKAADDAKEVAWFPLDELPAMAFDHSEIVKMGIALHGK